MIGGDPLFYLGRHGVIEALFEPLALWGAQCDARVGGHALPAGHFLAEELPAETTAALVDFFG